MNARPWILACSLAAICSGALAQNRSFVAVRDDGIEILRVDLPAGMAAGQSVTPTLAAAVLADEGTQTLRASFSQAAVPGGGNSARTDLLFVRHLIVPAAGGLQPGDPTTLSFMAAADGSMSIDVEGLVDVDLDYTIDDPSSTLTTCDAGVCTQQRRVARFAFDAGWNRDLTNGVVTESGGASWSLDANGGRLVDGSAAGLGPFDTGPLLFTLNTHVGADLTLRGSLILFGIPYNDAGSRVGADFGNTFDVEVRDAFGQVIAGDLPGVRNFDGSVSAVPEPGSWALMLIGAAALLPRLRRRRDAGAAVGRGGPLPSSLPYATASASVPACQARSAVTKLASAAATRA